MSASSRGRLLLLTASTGAGHVSASNAIREASEKIGFVVQDLDCMDFCPVGFRRWYRGGYETLVRRSPAIWGYLYNSSDHFGFNFAFQTLLDWFFMARLGRIIQEFKPDWVVCTHSLPQPRLATLRSKFGFKIVVIVTDLYPHKMWLRGQPDLYCLPNQDSLELLKKRVGEQPSAYVTGIPISDEFSLRPISATDKEVPTILLSAGGIGGGPVVEAAGRICELGVPLNLEVLCGSNEEAFETLSNYRVPIGVTLGVHRLIPNSEVAMLMRTADLFIGKSGGLTTFEALTSGLPFLVLDPFLIPGQEELNARYLCEIGAGTRARTLEEMQSNVKELILNPGLLKEMRVHAEKNARPLAAQEVVQLLGFGVSGQDTVGPELANVDQKCLP